MTAVRRAATDARLVPVAAGAWCCAWLGTGTDRGPFWAWLAGAALLGAGLGAALVGRRLARTGESWSGADRRPAGLVVVALACLGLVACSTAEAQADRYRTPLGRWAAEGRTASVVGAVTADPREVRSAPAPASGPPRWLVTVRVQEAVARGQRVSGASSVLVVGGEAVSRLEVGSTVRLVGRLRATEVGEKPVAVLRLTSPPDTLRRPGPVWQAADRVRAGLRDASADLHPDARGMLPSLVLGDTSRLPSDLESDMTTAGLTHLTAVSGANLAIVGGAVLLLAASLGVRRRPRVVLAAVAIAGFCVAARPEPSVLRAAAMGGVGLLGLVGGRRASAVPAVAVSVVLLLTVDPWLSRSYGFALSVLATLGLVVLAPRLAERWSRRLPRWLALGLAVPVAAQLACSPVLVMLDPSVSLVAVPANLLADVAVAPATLCGLVAALLQPLSGTAAHGVAWVGGLACRWIALVARTAAPLPGATVPWPDGAAGVTAMLGAVAGVVLLGLGTGRLRAGTALRVACVVALVVPAGTGGWVAAEQLPGPWRRGGAGPWDAVLCDVGQGLSVVLRLAPGHHLLVDTGPDPDAVDGCLRGLGVTRLDAVVLTHHHADHIGGLAGVVRGRQVGEVIVGPLDEPAGGAERVRRFAGEHRIPVRRAAAGTSRVLDGPPRPGAVGPEPDVPELAGPVGWTAVWPRPQDVSASVGDDERVNDLSLVLDVRTVSGLRVLVLGDVETWAQERLARVLAESSAGADVTEGLEAVDLVVVAHHGSADQSGELYRRLRAPVGLIGVGEGNDYGHPDPRTLQLLSGASTRVWRSDLAGDVAVTRTNGRLLVGSP